MAYLSLFAVNPGLGGVVTTIASFGPSTGSEPHCTLIQATDGYLYGTTRSGGAFNCGTIFRVGLDGALVTLASFNGTNGEFPVAGLLQAGDGCFYGTTEFGGPLFDGLGTGGGTIFRFSTNSGINDIVGFTVNANPVAPLIQASNGTLYGTTLDGVSDPYGNGTVFDVTQMGVYQELFQFPASSDTNYLIFGGALFGGLTQGSDGKLYGTASEGGPGGFGTVWQITNGGFPRILADFAGADGVEPMTGVVEGPDGAYYGTTVAGGYGYYSGTSGNGTVFRVTTNGNLTSLHYFTNSSTDPDGSGPNGLMLASDGSFYGTTLEGANFGPGVVFKISTNGMFALISTNLDQGTSPYAELVQAADGNLYGTTSAGGAFNQGTIFRVNIVPAFVSISLLNRTVSMTWNSLVDQSYQVEFKDNLSCPTWKELGQPVVATNTLSSISDLPTGATRFYRIKVLPN